MGFTTELTAKFAPSSALLLLFILVSGLKAQDAFFERSWLEIDSESMQRKMKTEICIPNNFLLARNDLQIPLIVLFDRQNENTFNYNLHTLGYSSNFGAQMPDCLVAGVYFDNNERTALTSTRADLEVNIQQTEGYLFEELLPTLKDKYPGISRIILIGHSRTAYLVNYLTQKRSSEFDVAVACSGFIEDDETQAFFKDLPEAVFRNRDYPFRYYMSSGDSFEEENYLKHDKRIEKYFINQELPENFEWEFKVYPDANHMTNYTMTIAWVVNDLFRDYNTILSSRFESDFKKDLLGEFPDTYMSEMDQLFVPVSPTLLHINSITSAFVNMKDFNRALKMIDLGIENYPHDPGLYLFKAEVAHFKGEKDLPKVYLKEYQDVLKNHPVNRDYLLELRDWETYLEELITK